MRFTTLLLAVASAKAISGHTLFSTLVIDDESQGDATCIRMPMDGATSTSPLIDLSSNNMACNVDGSTGVARVCPATQGSRLTFVWRWTANEPDAGSIDISHKGPCAVYMKKVESAIKDPGHGDGWFKIYDYGHDDETNEWCTEKLIKAGGLLAVNLPSDLAGGYYLVRPELLSLHQAFADDNNPTSQPQFYTGCAQIFLDSTATGSPTDTVSIPGYVRPEDPAATFNIYYNQKFPYPQLGPPVSSITNSNSRIRVKSRAPLEPQTEGLRPDNCVDENGNWCGIELDSYDSSDGCLAQGKKCWEQLDPCYKGAPPTGYQGCSAWEEKCSAMTDSCNAGNFVGPPNPGKIITPAKHEYDLSKAIGMPRVQAVVPDVKPSQVASSLVSSSVAASSAAASNLVVSSIPTVSSSKTTDAPAATTAPSYPGSVNDGARNLDPDNGDDDVPAENDADVETVFVTQTITVNVAAAAETPCPPDQANAKRQTFQFKSASDGSDLAVSPADSSAQVPAKSFPIIPETLAPVEAALQSAPLPAFIFKESTDSDADSISVETRPVTPTRDGSCGLVSGFRCEYDSILGTIPGCCSRFGYCGYSPDHCGSGCQVGYGRCDGLPSRMAKRYNAHFNAALSAPVSTAKVEFAATVKATPICGATAGPRDAFLPDAAEPQRVHAQKLWGKGGRTLTVDAASCTPSAEGTSSGHFHKHRHPVHR